jgi:hypothetical protein
MGLVRRPARRDRKRLVGKTQVKVGVPRRVVASAMSKRSRSKRAAQRDRTGPARRGPVLKPFTDLERRERQWAHGHRDTLARRAEHEMQKWKLKLSPSARASIGEPTRHERVATEMQSERRSRRTVIRMTVAAGTALRTTGPGQSAKGSSEGESPTGGATLSAPE